MAGSSLVPAARRDVSLPGVRLPRPAPAAARTLLEKSIAREPGELPFYSRPRDWTAEQLKDAALHVLRLEADALRHGQTLERVSAESVQFRGSYPVWTDAGALTAHRGGPWAAGADFSRIFLAPLMLAAHGQARGDEPETIQEASRRLPAASYFKPGALRHIHLPARIGAWAGARLPAEQAVAALWRTVERLDPNPRWAPWKSADCGREDGLLRILLKEAVRLRGPRLVYLFGDGGGNCARTIAAEGVDCISFDADPGRVAACYLHERAAGGSRLLPLVGSLADSGRLAPVATRGELAVVLSRGLEPLMPLGLLPEEAAALLLRAGERVLLEFDPAEAKADLGTLLAAFRPWFRPAELAEISSSGRCLCSLEPA